MPDVLNSAELGDPRVVASSIERSAAELDEAASPVEYPPPFEAEDRGGPREGIGLCLSGGGYRAMLFHLGALWRLNELAYLPRINRISSVSGGSITSARLAISWNQLGWDNGVATRFVEEVVEPIHGLASRTIDRRSVLGGAVVPLVEVSDFIQRAYRKHLFGDATLQDFPREVEGFAPRFILNATNVQSGAIWRFSRPYMADWRVGRVSNPTVAVSQGVAASSAFPPVLSPCRLRLQEGAVEDSPGTELHRTPFTTRVLLTDGGVYDNLGLETVWKNYRTVLVSDGGGQMVADPKPSTGWARHSLRINSLIDNQVRSLRKRQVVGAFERGEREGTYWRMRGNIQHYRAPETLPCPWERTIELARTPTRLKALSRQLQERIVNWGYALCDAALRTYVDTRLSAPQGFPYSNTAV